MSRMYDQIVRDRGRSAAATRNYDVRSRRARDAIGRPPAACSRLIGSAAVRNGRGQVVEEAAMRLIRSDFAAIRRGVAPMFRLERIGKVPRQGPIFARSPEALGHGVSVPHGAAGSRRRDRGTTSPESSRHRNSAAQTLASSEASKLEGAEAPRCAKALISSRPVDDKLICGMWVLASKRSGPSTPEHA